MDNTPSRYDRKLILWAVITPQIIMLSISALWILIFPKDNIMKYLKFTPVFFAKGFLVGAILGLAGYLFYIFAKKTKLFYEAVELFEVVLSPAFKNLQFLDLLILSSVSGFSEEVFFRGLLFPKIGIILSSIAFGIMHLPKKKFWIYAVWATGSGFLFAYLLKMTGSLWIPITAHAINNLIGMILLKNLTKSQN